MIDFMMKEIYEQPSVIKDTYRGRLFGKPRDYSNVQELKII